jgi:hypothetical protein
VGGRRDEQVVNGLRDALRLALRLALLDGIGPLLGEDAR